MKKKFYAYLLVNENVSGIVDNWEECKKIVDSKPARYKSFTTYEDASNWLESGAKYEKKLIEKEKIDRSKLDDGIYFDAGTGRGRGVEVRVTNKFGDSLLMQNMYKNKLILNEFQNFELGFEKTNNYGELLGLYVALDVAISNKQMKIFGDSHLVLFFWSVGRYHPENLDEATVRLIEATIQKRKDFEKMGGKIFYIAGDVNPADLGFHK